MHGGVYRAAQFCPHCFFEHEGGRRKGRKKMVSGTSTMKDDTLRNDAVKSEALQSKADAMQVTAGTMQVEEVYAEEVVAPEPPPRQVVPVILTTKAAGEQTILESLEEVTAECVLNLKVTPDLISNGKFVGTKSEKVRAALEQGKKHVLSQLRQKAQERGANIVTDVAVKNAVKTSDSQSVKIVVKASGQAAVAETTAETSEV
jgi:uncharacterized protein YbjQ (UPF0145 family)